MIYAVAARFPGLGDPRRLKLSDILFWHEGHKIMIDEETNSSGQ